MKKNMIFVMKVASDNCNKNIYNLLITILIITTVIVVIMLIVIIMMIIKDL